MVWWKKPYINRRDWLLENQSSLKITSDQLLILLMIDFLNSNREVISLDTLSNRTALDISTIDTSMQSLVSKNYLKISVVDGMVDFSIDGIFENGLLYEHVDESIFGVFETEFARLLSQSELQTLNTWLKTYPEDMILDALRSAVIYKKLNMKYINSILLNMKKEQQ